MNVLDVFHAGFHDLVSVLPPGAEVAPHSRIDAKDAGKVPGHKNAQGLWVGYPWMHYRPDEQDIQTWMDDGANIGFGAWAFPALDIDVTDPALVHAVVNAVEDITGPTLQRTGRAPKTLLVFRCATPLKAFDMHYTRDGHPLLGAERQLIQFLGLGRQYVMLGTHPGTGQPYQLHDPNNALVAGPKSLPPLTPDLLVDVFDAINEVMFHHGYQVKGNATARGQVEEVDQADLKAPSLKHLAAVVNDIPNTTPHRDEYIEMGYAIKGAGQDDPEAALAIFQSWCDRWEYHNDPEQVARDWHKMVPPYRSGYSSLIHKGQEWGVNMAHHTFGPADPTPAAPSVADTSSPQAPPTPKPAPLLTDIGLMEAFLEHYGARYRVLTGTQRHGIQYQWNGTYWERKDGDIIEQAVRDFLRDTSRAVARQIESDAARIKLLERLQSDVRVRAVSRLVTHHEAIICTPDDVDEHDDPDILNTPDGPYDLKTGERLTPDPNRLMLRCTRVAPSQDSCPTWKTFLADVTEGNKELEHHLQTLVGYSLTGHADEQRILYLFGETGDNGKSVFLNLLDYLLGAAENGGYAQFIQVDALMQMRGDGSRSSEQLVKLHGARLIYTSEPKAQSKWDDGLIKQLSGDNYVSGKALYQNSIRFRLKGSIIVEGNNLPRLDTVGHAIRRRMHVIPWTFQCPPEKRDKTLGEKLKAESGAILAWAVEGARRWYIEGLGRPQEVIEASDEYLETQDDCAQYLAECVSSAPANAPRDQYRVSNDDMYQHYCQWAMHRHITPLSKERFDRNKRSPLRMLGAAPYHNSAIAQRGWEGIVLIPLSPEAPPQVSPFTPSP